MLTGAGFGTPLSWQTEIGHKLPYGYTQYADLTMLAPDAGVPVMLLEVDRVNEPVDDLVAKLRRYTDWFELPAPKADLKRQPAARLWSRLYPATGQEGYVPVAFVFTGKTAAQRESRMRRLEQAARRYFAGTEYPGAGITAVNYHQAVPVIVTELERITADPKGAGGAVCGAWGVPTGRPSPRRSTTPTATACTRWSCRSPGAARRNRRQSSGRRSGRCAGAAGTSSPTTAGTRSRSTRRSSTASCADRACANTMNRRRRNGMRGSRRNPHPGSGRSGSEEEPRPVRPPPIVGARRAAGERLVRCRAGAERSDTDYPQPRGKNTVSNKLLAPDGWLVLGLPWPEQTQDGWGECAVAVATPSPCLASSAAPPGPRRRTTEP
ncbi:hypothetical protein [Streptomyces avermitilis]|uniref:hypothetical protein n=1 Tax=Streptomyces avermitilis TaxID=33903 RepID=UPI0033CB8538